MSVVHGALAHYDLPDLAATLGDKLTIEQPVDAQGAVARAGWHAQDAAMGVVNRE